MLLSRPLIVDDKVWGGIYTFEHEGDVFPIHVHTDADNHITTLLFGAVRCIGHENYEGVVLEAAAGGTIVDWVAGEPHGFVALVAGTTLMNVLKARR